MTILDFIYPPRCLSCLNIFEINGERNICGECRNKLQYIEKPVCLKCGNSVENEYTICCDNLGTVLDYNRSVFKYNETMRSIIHRFKYKNELSLGGYFGKIMAEKYENTFSEIPHIIVAVPIHKNKKKERGYNQAKILAKEISKRLKVPILSDKAFIRVSDTKIQSILTKEERIENIKGAFIVENSEDIKGKRILIVDDIYTTGSTLNECSRVLLKCGARGIFSYTLARPGGTISALKIHYYTNPD